RSRLHLRLTSGGALRRDGTIENGTKREHCQENGDLFTAPLALSCGPDGGPSRHAATAAARSPYCPRGNSGPEAFRHRMDYETRCWNRKAASVPSLRKFVSEGTAVYCELQKLGTKVQRLLFTVGAILALAAHAGAAAAQDYPVRTVRIVVPYAPGGGVSLLAQTVANKMSELMKQPVIVDNRPGAAGNLGADVVAKSTPDGYTLLMHTSAMASAPSLYAKLPFDPVKDFAPVTMVIATQFVIGGSPKNSPRNLRELIALAKEKPDAYNFGSSGAGSSLHLFAEIFNNTAGIKLVHVPYRGDAQIVTALIADEVQVAFLPQANGIAG